jgi:aminoglycoside 3-N-acetyltransferase
MTTDARPWPAPAGPIGREQLAADLDSLGLHRGQDLLIHCSLRRTRQIEGGAATLLAAIREVAGPCATLVVPTQTAGNSFSSDAFRAATAGMGATERARFVAAMPGFDPASTPSTGMGAFAEYLRTQPSACRSSHPQTSFAAIGSRARACTSVHDLDCHLGDRSPLGWLYTVGAAILLLGVGYSVCTAFHLAEYRLPGEPPRRSYRCFVSEGGKRAEREFADIDLDDSDFALLGADLEAIAETGTSSGLRRGLVGAAECRLVPMRLAVDFACSWLVAHRMGTARDETV